MTEIIINGRSLSTAQAIALVIAMRTFLDCLHGRTGEAERALFTRIDEVLRLMRDDRGAQ